MVSRSRITDHGGTGAGTFGGKEDQVPPVIGVTNAIHLTGADVAWGGVMTEVTVVDGVTNTFPVTFQDQLFFTVDNTDFNAIRGDFKLFNDSIIPFAAIPGTGGGYTTAGVNVYQYVTDNASGEAVLVHNDTNVGGTTQLVKVNDGVASVSASGVGTIDVLECDSTNNQSRLSSASGATTSHITVKPDSINVDVEGGDLLVNEGTTASGTNTAINGDVLTLINNATGEAKRGSASAINEICDADMDTCLEVERTPDDDTIWGKANSIDVLKIKGLTDYKLIIEDDLLGNVGTDGGLFGFDHGAGEFSAIKIAETGANKSNVLCVLEPATGTGLVSSRSAGNSAFATEGRRQNGTGVLSRVELQDGFSRLSWSDGGDLWTCQGGLTIPNISPVLPGAWVGEISGTESTGAFGYAVGGGVRHAKLASIDTAGVGGRDNFFLTTPTYSEIHVNTGEELRVNEGTTASAGGAGTATDGMVLTLVDSTTGEAKRGAAADLDVFNISLLASPVMFQNADPIGTQYTLPYNLPITTNSHFTLGGGGVVTCNTTGDYRVSYDTTTVAILNGPISIIGHGIAVNGVILPITISNTSHTQGDLSEQANRTINLSLTAGDTIEHISEKVFQTGNRQIRLFAGYNSLYITKI